MPTDAVTEAPADSPTPPAVALERHARRVCVFMLGDHSYAVDVRDAREVVILDGHTRVPGAPATVLGVFNLRGTVVPLVEARPLLGEPARAVAAGAAAVILAARTWRAAVAIDRVLGLEWMDDAALVAPHGESVGGEFAAGTFAPDNGDAITLLDADRLLAALRGGWTSSRFDTTKD